MRLKNFIMFPTGMTPDYNSSADNTMTLDMREFVPNCGPGDYGLLYGFQVLVGDDIYYTLGSFESRTISWAAADVISIRRKSASNPEKDEVIREAFDTNIINGLMDTGEDLLLWSNWQENSCFKVWRMSYNGKKTSLILNQPLEIQILDAILVKNCLWYTGYTFDYDTRTVRAEIYRLDLDSPEPICIYSSDTVISELLYAEKKLFFIETEQALKSLDPNSGEIHMLVANDKFTGFSTAYTADLNFPLVSGAQCRKLIALNGRIYFWCDWNRSVMSIRSDGSDLKMVMDKGQIYFRQILKDGVTFETSYAAYNQYLCRYSDPSQPSFDPENSFLEQWDYDDYVLGLDV